MPIRYSRLVGSNRVLFLIVKSLVNCFSTPMMDLLVQVTTANKISPGGHVIQAIGDRGVLPYKPSTPIGMYCLLRAHTSILSFEHA